MFRLLLLQTPTSDAGVAHSVVAGESEEERKLQRVIHAQIRVYKRSTASPLHSSTAAPVAPAAPGDDEQQTTSADDCARREASAAASAGCAPSPAAPASPHGLTPAADSHQSRRLLLVALPHTLSTSHLLRHIAGLQATELEECTRIVDPRSGQHALLLTWRRSDDARAFYQRLHNHAFHPLRREIAYVLHLSEVEQRAHPTNAPDPSPPSHFLELPSCPRCLAKLDSSLTDIVSELDQFSILRVRVKPTHPASGDDGDGPVSLQWVRRRVPIWPEIHCAACRIVQQAQRGDKELSCPQCVQSSSSSSPSAAAFSSSSSLPTVVKSSLSDSLFPPDNSLWLCLLCGQFGCGRYAASGGQHAFAHAQSSSHNYALEVLSSHSASGAGAGVNAAIWDYANDGFIQRVQHLGHGYRRYSMHAFASAAAVDEYKSDDGEERKEGETSEELDDELLNWSGWNDSSSAHAHAAPDLPASASPDAPHLLRSASHGFSLSSHSPAPTFVLSADSAAGQALRAASDGVDPLLIPDYGLDLEEESALLHSKLESIASFYNSLLNDTLRRQYDYFSARAAEQAEEDTRQREEVESQLERRIVAAQRHVTDLSTQLASLESQQRTSERSVRDLSARLAKLQEENAFLKDLNANLLSAQSAARKKGGPPLAANNGASPGTQAEPSAASSAPTSSAATSSASSASLPSASTPPVVSPSTVVSSSSSDAASSSSAAPAPAAAAAATACSASSLALQSLDPHLVAKYTRLRAEKAKRIAALEREVAEAMEEIDRRAAKEAAQKAAADKARADRVKRAMGSSSSSSSAKGGARRG